jgi:GT2 family glycosyltransferase
MKIAVYSMTRERVAYSRVCLASLRDNAGAGFRHFILDNGSTDGTLGWLLEFRYDSAYSISFSPTNMGISVASNLLVKNIFSTPPEPDLIIKFDNDCLVLTANILRAFAEIYETCEEAKRWVLSPRVEGIVNQPRRVREHRLADRKIGVTALVGGLFQVVPAPIMREFMADGGYDETLPPAHGQDDFFAEWLRVHGYANGYVEDLVVEHYRGTEQQAVDYPEYFTRKWREEKEGPVAS